MSQIPNIPLQRLPNQVTAPADTSDVRLAEDLQNLLSQGARTATATVESDTAQQQRNMELSQQQRNIDIAEMREDAALDELEYTDRARYKAEVGRQRADAARDANIAADLHINRLTSLANHMTPPELSEFMAKNKVFGDPSLTHKVRQFQGELLAKSMQGDLRDKAATEYTRRLNAVTSGLDNDADREAAASQLDHVSMLDLVGADDVAKLITDIHAPLDEATGAAFEAAASSWYKGLVTDELKSEVEKAHAVAVSTTLHAFETESFRRLSAPEFRGADSTVVTAELNRILDKYQPILTALGPGLTRRDVAKVAMDAIEQMTLEQVENMAGLATDSTWKRYFNEPGQNLPKWINHLKDKAEADNAREIAKNRDRLQGDHNSDMKSWVVTDDSGYLHKANQTMRSMVGLYADALVDMDQEKVDQYRSALKEMESNANASEAHVIDIRAKRAQVNATALEKILKEARDPATLLRAELADFGAQIPNAWKIEDENIVWDQERAENDTQPIDLTTKFAVNVGIIPEKGKRILRAGFSDTPTDEQVLASMAMMIRLNEVAPGVLKNALDSGMGTGSAETAIIERMRVAAVRATQPGVGLDDLTAEATGLVKYGGEFNRPIEMEMEVRNSKGKLVKDFRAIGLSASRTDIGVEEWTTEAIKTSLGEQYAVTKEFRDRFFDLYKLETLRMQPQGDSLGKLKSGEKPEGSTPDERIHSTAIARAIDGLRATHVAVPMPDGTTAVLPHENLAIGNMNSNRDMDRGALNLFSTGLGKVREITGSIPDMASPIDYGDGSIYYPVTDPYPPLNANAADTIIGFVAWNPGRSQWSAVMSDGSQLSRTKVVSSYTTTGRISGEPKTRERTETTAIPARNGASEIYPDLVTLAVKKIPAWRLNPLQYAKYDDTKKDSVLAQNVSEMRTVANPEARVFNVIAYAAQQRLLDQDGKYIPIRDVRTGRVIGPNDPNYNRLMTIMDDIAHKIGYPKGLGLEYDEAEALP